MKGLQPLSCDTLVQWGRSDAGPGCPDVLWSLCGEINPAGDILAASSSCPCLSRPWSRWSRRFLPTSAVPWHGSCCLIKLTPRYVHFELNSVVGFIARFTCGCPFPDRVQGQVGRGLEHPGLVEGVPAHGRGVGTRWALRSLATWTILWLNLCVSILNKNKNDANE